MLFTLFIRFLLIIALLQITFEILCNLVDKVLIISIGKVRKLCAIQAKNILDSLSFPIS